MKLISTISLLVVLLITGCSNPVDIHQTREREYEIQVTWLKQRVIALQDSLAMYTAADTNIVVHHGPAKNKTINERGNGDTDPTEPGLYKNVVYHHTHVSQSASNTPGLFPEGSDRLLFIKDVVYLSDWGLLLMLNEIYARHGMTFSNAKLTQHFTAQRWYHGTATNVTSRLSTTELQNVDFLKTYKYTPAAGE
jgi:hypothetical protein